MNIPQCTGLAGTLAMLAGIFLLPVATNLALATIGAGWLVVLVSAPLIERR